MCMIQRWRDEAPTEKRFYDENPGGDPYYIIETLPRVEARSVDPPMEHELRLDLRSGRVVVVKALVRNYANWRSTAYPHLRSPHGTMTSGHHMVVLTSGTDDGYRFLDPFYTVDAQPLEVSDDAFTNWFVGHAFIASR
jgi:hypothetical protein